MINQILKILLFGIICLNFSFPQWSTDPNNNLIIGYGQDPKICSDSAGGCYVTYNYGTLSYPQKLAVERLDKFGYKPWGTLKQILGELPEQWQAEIIEDGEGGLIVSYQDNEWIPPAYFNSKVRVQKVDSSGNFLWGLTGVRVTIEETNHGQEPLVSDGEGGCVIVWQDYDGEYSINRINKWGERVWGDSGKVLGISAYTNWKIIRAVDGNYYVETGEYIYRIRQNGEIIREDSVILGYIVPDAEGGIVLSGRVGSINNRKLVAQRKDSLGNNLWQEPYVEIADSLDIGTSLNILANNNHYHYGWLGRKNGVAEILQIQSLRFDGTKLFLGGSISLSDSPTSVTSIPIISSDSGSNIYAWTQWDSPQNYNANFARKIDSTGSDIWFQSFVLLNEPSLGYFSMITDCAGGAIGVGYLNADFAIRVLKISANGNLGEVVIPVELISFSAKVINKKVELNWQTVTEINNMGFEIERKDSVNSSKRGTFENWEKIGSVPGFGTTTEPKIYSFIEENVTTGIYKYRLKQVDYDGTFKYSDEIEIQVGFVPKEYILFQNYPNPFNSNTIISYYVPIEGRVSIKLYSAIGESIKTITEGFFNAGTYRVNLSSEDLTSGIYFYTMQTEKTSLTKKLIIIK